MKEQLKNKTEQDILVNVIREEIDFISYVDVDTENIRTIVTNENSDVMPPLDGDYTKTNLDTIPLYVHPEDRKYCEEMLELSNLKKELETKDRLNVTYRLLCGNQYRRKEMKIYYQQVDNKTMVFVRRDVTDIYEEEQKQKERLSHALMEAKHANREKNDFLERMSHEIRTPMNSIIGLSYLSKANMDNKKQILENIDKIDMSAHFLLSFVNDILNLSRIESGNIALNEEETDFSMFLEELVRKVKAKADQKKSLFPVKNAVTLKKRTVLMLKN